MKIDKKYTETLDILIEVINEYCYEMRISDSSRCLLSHSECEFKQVVETIEEMKTILQKQIAIEPDLSGDGYDDNGEILYDTWSCPNCESAYEVGYHVYKHCPNCGQKLKTDRMEV